MKDRILVRGEKRRMARVIVVGGGIGGLTTAIAFCRKGWDVSVHEATRELRPVGKGIWVPSNAMQVLGRLGLAEHVSETGWPVQSIELRTASGTLLSSLKLNELTARQGYSIISIRRADLVEILANRLQPGVLHLGSQFTHFTPEATQVRAHFEDGSEQTADLLVGADGIHSRVRQQLFPRVALRYSGQTCFRGISEIALPDVLAFTCREVWGGRNRFGFSAVGPCHVYWFAPQLSPPRVEDSLDLRMEQLLDSYKKFPNPIPEILAAAKVEDTVRTDLFDFPPISGWSRHNVVLLGDAAHAMTPNLGQGGAQAVEDAYVLAEECGQAASVAEALENYERIRMPKAEWIVKTSWSFGQISHWQNPLVRWVRDSAIRWTPSAIRQKQLNKLYSLNY
jgi:2-polyprenyl-6-methoxyphenol hydroxylase-like FAD-dependent oxidoreductase